MNVFKINHPLKFKSETFRGTKIYQCDNFFQFPEQVVEFLDASPPELHKRHEPQTNNGVHFTDRRHILYGANELIDTLSLLDIGEPPSDYKCSTNFTKFEIGEYNDYQNNYWYPHRDNGYTAIVYLNHYTGPGTNLYERENDYPPAIEHMAPWRKRSNYRVIKTLEASFNRLVVFQGNTFVHGMAIEDDTFFKEERKNIVVFFT